MSYLKEDLHVEDHSFLSEELLIPNVDKCDVSRVNMFTSHITQAVIPNEGETPLVFTRFENQVGKFASSFRAFDRKMWLVAIIPRNELNATYVFKEVGGNEKVHIVERRSHERTTESYGYRVNNDVLESVSVGQAVEPDTILVRSSTHDEAMNMKFGVNLNTLYSSIRGLNYEDGIVISESAARAMNHEVVEEVVVTVNNNDVLVNYLGDGSRYKSFPDIGEPVRDGILCGRRRISYDSALVDLSDRSLRSINYANDALFYAKGTVVDVVVYSNQPLDQVRAYAYNSQIAEYLEREQEYRRQLVEVLGPLVEGRTCGVHFTPEVGFLYGRAKAMLDPASRWTFEKSEFDGIVVKFIVANTENLVVGSKITNRYGGKGVISKILPDGEMPYAGDVRADVVFSCLGIINRLNPASLVEQELNFMATKVAERMSRVGSDEAWDVLIDFIRRINPEQAESFADMRLQMDGKTRTDAIEGMIDNGIPIHQPPFFGNVTLDQIRDLYRHYGFVPDKVDGVENPMIIGKVYFMVLKHNPDSKFSARSARYISVREVPAKNNRDFKAGQAVYSTTPVRLGEQELINLLLLKNPGETYRCIRQTSSSRSDREELIRSLLTGDPFNVDHIPAVDGAESHTMAILNSYLAGCGLQIVEE